MPVDPKQISVIDLFAGPGGLGEGFSSFFHSGCHPFQISLSIEKDVSAHKTLELRSFFRKFSAKEVPEAYYEYLRQTDIPEKLRRKTLFDKYPEKIEQVEDEARLAELGEEDPATIHAWISVALGNHLIGYFLAVPPVRHTLLLVGFVTSVTPIMNQKKTNGNIYI